MCDNRGIAMHSPLYPTATWSVVIMCSKQARCSKVLSLSLSLSLSSSDTGMGSSSSSRQCAGASPHCSYISWNPKMMQLRSVDKFATQSVQSSNTFPSLTQGDQEASSTSFWQFGRNFKLQTLLMGRGAGQEASSISFWSWWLSCEWSSAGPWIAGLDIAHPGKREVLLLSQQWSGWVEG